MGEARTYYYARVSSKDQNLDRQIAAFKELGADNLKTFITIKFSSMSDAKERLQMSVADIRAHYFELQRRLYCA